ncbi:MAG: cellulase family glycosylhydrolase [Spirochaetales bacterium]|nr:cellulase family glycosylhydrolase [Spirochaetales bacterium]
MNYLPLFCVVCLVFASCAAVPDVPSGPEELPPVDPSLFVRTDGRLLKAPDGSEFLIKGIAFGNAVWSNPADPSDFTHHRMDAYADVRSMGFNSVRFYLNYRLFEEDGRPYRYKESGFAWLDRNIAAAKAQGVYLVLNMHYPQGGFQSNGGGDALWTDSDNQARLVALWTAIARRYRDEPHILGYGLVNEPVPVNGIGQWKALAQQIIDSIRRVDTHHLLFVERAIWTKAETTKGERDFLLFPEGIIDPAGRLVYEFHMYEPMAFSHQNASWTQWKGFHSAYPDPSRVEIRNRQWAGFTRENPRASTGSFEWERYEGVPFKVEDPTFIAGYPVFQARAIGKGGTAWMDDIAVEEFDDHGNSLGVIWSSSVDADFGWAFWAKDGKGSLSLADTGRSGGKSLFIEGTTGDANITASEFGFRVVQGHSYSINGYVKGRNIASGADVRLRIDFYSGDSSTGWDIDYLNSYLTEFIELSRKLDLPFYLGEFGLITYAFEEDRGGARWLSDMLTLLNRYRINYNYHTYHEGAFGLYMNHEGFPDPERANTAAISVLKELQTGMPSFKE